MRCVQVRWLPTVPRRTGGLEMFVFVAANFSVVPRRTGGLETTLARFPRR